MTAEPQTKISALDFLGEYVPPHELQMADYFRLAYNIACACDDPEDGARSALSVLIVMVRERCRHHSGPYMASIHPSIIEMEKARVHEFGEVANELQAIVDATSPD